MRRLLSSECHDRPETASAARPPSARAANKIDLRYSGALGNSTWTDVVLGGSLQPYGMVSFSKELSKENVEAIRAYVIFRANQSLADLKPGKH